MDKDESTVKQKDESTVKQKDKPIVKQKDRPGLPAGLRSMLWLLFPRRCAMCGEVLEDWGKGLCLRCLTALPRTGYHHERENKVERLFWGRFPIERASSYLFFKQGNLVQRLVHQMKYHGRQDLCRLMGREMGRDLSTTRFFEGMDAVMPVPMHRGKAWLRGYNQAAELAQGLSEVTGLEMVTDAMEKVRASGSQTRLQGAERWDNVQGTYRVVRADRLRGRHVLVVDDVLTTGSTLTACAELAAAVEGVRVSVLTLTLAQDWAAAAAASDEPRSEGAEPGLAINPNKSLAT